MMWTILPSNPNPNNDGVFNLQREAFASFEERGDEGITDEHFWLGDAEVVVFLKQKTVFY